MQKADSPRGSRWTVVLFLTALLVVAADQLSKIWVRSYLEGQLIYKLGFFQLTHVSNTGAAFGLFRGQSLALTVVAIVGIVAILSYALFAYRHFTFVDSMSNRVALGLILGGIVGNLVDRLRLGYVTDFIGVGIWPVFNIADSAAVVGVIIFAYSVLRSARTEKDKTQRGEVDK